MAAYAALAALTPRLVLPLSCSYHCLTILRPIIKLNIYVVSEKVNVVFALSECLLKFFDDFRMVFGYSTGKRLIVIQKHFEQFLIKLTRTKCLFKNYFDQTDRSCQM